MATDDLTDPATLFFGVYRRKVLGLLLLHPGETFHLREIARVTHTQPGTLRRELALLTQAGVLVSQPQGNQVRFRANERYPIYEELRSILKKTSGVADELRAALASLAAGISVAFIYGSVASGEEGTGSDIDLMIVGTVQFEEVIRAIRPAEEQLRREINPQVYSPGEFKRKAGDPGSFISRVLKLPKLFVLGGVDELGKPGEDGPAPPA